jgi:hypothetical protein
MPKKFRKMQIYEQVKKEQACPPATILGKRGYNVGLPSNG